MNSHLPGVLASFLLVAPLCHGRAPDPAGGAVGEGAVVYGVVPTLFGEEPFNSVRAKLDHLEAQGVDVLWISPVFKTDDPSAISYSITDYFAIREDFGTAAEFKGLVREAKRRGMKVIIDFVPNHTSSAHPFYLDAEKNGRKSRYYRFYDRDGEGKATHYFDWKHLPNLNFDHPEVSAMIFDALTYWVREYGVEGFRMDAAWGIRKRSPAFWPDLNRKLAADAPGIVLVAEASARDSYYSRSGFHLAYDWTGKLGRWAWEGIFTDPDETGARLSALFARHPPTPGVLRFLNNNDTGRRFVSRHGAGITKVAAVLQHTLPGTVLVYTGDEVGAEYEPYQDPPPISWEDGHGLQALYRKLAELREELAGLRAGDWAEAPIQDNRAAYAYLRSTGIASESVLVILNFGREAVVEFALPAQSRAPLAFDLTRDALTGKKRLVEPGEGRGSWRVRMEAKSAVVLRAD